jgi:hypothetical protein
MTSATAVTANSSRLQAFIFIGVMLLGAIFVMLMLKEHDGYSASVTGELNIVRDSLSDNDWSKVREKTVRAYNWWFHDSGFYELVFEALIPESKTAWDEVVKYEWNERFAMNAQVFAYQITHRLIMIEYWVWLLLPAMIAVIWTGVNAFRSKIFIIGGVKPNIVRLYLKASWVLINLFLIYLMTPNFLGAWAPFAPAIFLMLFSMLTMGIIQAFHKGTN